MTRTALLVVDMLTDFFIAKPGLPVRVRMAPLVANTQKVCRKAREKGIPVVFANDNFQKTEVPIDRHFVVQSPRDHRHGRGPDRERPGVRRGPGLHCDQEDVRRLLQHPHGLDPSRARRQDLRGDRDLDECLRAAPVMGAWCRGYDVIVLKDCCSCPDEKEHEHALAYMKQFYGTEAMDSATWIAQLDAQ